MAHSQQNPWRRTGSRPIYENPWMRVREDQVIRPDGRPGIYGVVEIPASVAVLAVDDADRIALVGQWRYARGHYSWELPLGSSHPGEGMLEVAARELREETGATARDWERLGQLDVGIGVTTDTAHLFLATGIDVGASDPEPSERLEIRWLPFGAALDEVLAGKIREANSATAILKLALRRMKNGV